MTIKRWIFWIIGIGVGLGLAIVLGSPGWAGNPSSSPVLSGWQAPETIEDYREQIQATPLGYLRWQRFPVRIAIEPIMEPGIEPSADTLGDTLGTSDRDRRWVAAVRGAIADWQPYFPLVEVMVEAGNPDDWDAWDIYVHRSRPPLQRLRDGTILPARFADTRYEFLTPAPGISPTQFRFRIRMGNQQGEQGLRSTARHELGHALGLWGHSPNPQDVMYPAQIGTYPPISDRDLKTLQWLYQFSLDP